MQRDVVLSLAVLACLWFTFRNPFAGILAWAWLTIMQPHREVYGFVSNSLRLNLLIALASILAWLFSKQRKLPLVDGTFIAVVALLIWMTFNCLFAVDPANSWVLWDNTWRVFALALLVGAMANTKLQIHALTWIIAVSLLYYGIRGGLLSLMYGGAKRIEGPLGTIISDNNQLALALLMILPLVNYLRMHSANRFVRIELTGAWCLTFLSVVSSYSRGAYLALAALAILGWLRSRNKLLYPILISIVVWPVLKFMPQSFYDRLNTLSAPGQEEDFRTRVLSWRVAYYYARDHFPFGAGFAGPEQRKIYGYYFPGEPSHAAHSIYFQVLGEHGFIGLALFVTILFLALLNTYRIRKATYRRPELTWAFDLATAIQLGVFVYCIGGAALSMAYDDVFFIWAMLLPVLRQIVTETTRNPIPVPETEFAFPRARVSQQNA